jgi:hypothetical protein
MPANKTRLAGPVLFSLAAHVALLCALLTWLARPPVYRMQEDETPPWVVRLVPSLPPPPPRAAAATNRASADRPVLPIVSRPASERDEVAPIPVPGPRGEVASDPTGRAGSAGESGDDAGREKVRRALRGGAVGCANAERVGLNRQERVHCADIFGKDMVAIQRAMRDVGQNRLSLGGDPPKDYNLFRDACRALREQPGAQGGPC